MTLIIDEKNTWQNTEQLFPFLDKDVEWGGSTSMWSDENEKRDILTGANQPLFHKQSPGPCSTVIMAQHTPLSVHTITYLIYLISFRLLLSAAHTLISISKVIEVETQ